VVWLWPWLGWCRRWRWPSYFSILICCRSAPATVVLCLLSFFTTLAFLLFIIAFSSTPFFPFLILCPQPEEDPES
jgi:hypothetical protein